MIARGGPAVAGAAVGILMLQARFPRVVGEVGNACTFDFPVHYKVVRDASPDRVVRRRAEGLLDAFIDGARELVAMGADGIATNCGFLALFQGELAAALDVPVASSSLMQYRLIQSMLPPGKRVGIITISSDTLSDDHLRSAGIPLDAPVVGTRPDCHFNAVIFGDLPELDTDRACEDVLEAARRLVGEHENIGAMLLECTNMCPYSDAVADMTRLPVFDMVSFIRWFHQGLRPRRYGYSP
ncbi:MAG: aspartate/glutamate racemase family protein [Geminicoccaceae bacterium]|nr:aspartate/glutamate racemase family protein [Geminicoccaceae bacterium]MCB9943978.1 aspartate/glutamate racemase family protein [Geminicoccaceae bacterium]